MSEPTPDRLTTGQLDTLMWAASLGAVTAEALAVRESTELAAARGRLQALCRRGLLDRARPLTGRPALFVLTRAGLRASGARGIAPARVTAGEAEHSIACALAAAALESRYPDHRLLGEHELRREEREHGRPLASASLCRTHGAGTARLHRPDLVLIPNDPRAGLPVAVEVELTVKAAARLRDICRAWARCRTVAGVLYLASEKAERALRHALGQAHAHERVVVVPLHEVLSSDRRPRRTVATRP